jgi:hypothetical protein
MVLVAFFVFGAGQNLVFADISKSAETPLVIPLELQVMPALKLDSFRLAVKEMATPFKKEPALGNGFILRGTFSANEIRKTGFIWDQAKGRLYVDVNQNEDLTDDPVYTSNTDTGSGLSFSGVKVFSKKNTPVLLGGLRRYGSDLNAVPQSYLQGQLTLEGQEFQVAILDLPKNYSDTVTQKMLIRPWADRAQPFYEDACFALPKKLFLSGHAFNFKLVYDTNNVGCYLKFVPCEIQTSPVVITSSNLYQAVLRNNDLSVLISDLTGTNTVMPVGCYTYGDIWLKKGTNEAFGSLPQPYYVTLGKTNVFSIGGPLRNSVIVNRQGMVFRLDYLLTGGEKSKFTLAGKKRANPPQFRVMQAGKQVGGGAFEYG